MPQTRSAASRARSNSLRQGLAEVPLNNNNSNGVEGNASARASGAGRKVGTVASSSPASGEAPPSAAVSAGTPPPSATLLSDLVTWRWITNPASSLKIIVLVVLSWASIEYIPNLPIKHNYLTPALFISHPVTTAKGVTLYEKGPGDLVFLAFYVVVFSFLRQSVMEYALRPLAKWCGLKSDLKQVRFMEQAYAVVYNVNTAALGLLAMKNSPVWFYRTEHFWREYPHVFITAHVKYYYLLQAAYWSQQMLVLALRLEKPRTDYYQLIVHHLVTLWLIGWSYALNLTQIGVAVFISMDIPEIFLAGSKCLNYIGLQRTSEVSFVALLIVWTWMRHYLNTVMLWSVWNEFDLIPEYHRSWVAPITSPKDWWVLTDWNSGRVPYWIKYQIFIPIFILQCVNAYWSFLLWRIAYRIILGYDATDPREAGEDEEDEGTTTTTTEEKKNQ